MKETSKILKSLLAGTVALVAIDHHVSAATLSALDPTAPITVSTVPSTTLGPSNQTTTGTAGYTFFDLSPSTNDTSSDNLSVLPSYVTSVTATGVDGYYNGGSGTQAQGGFAPITIGGVSYISGVTIGAASTTGSDLATIELNQTDPGTVLPTFNVGILTDNTDGNYSANFSLTLYSGVPVAGPMGNEVTSTEINTTATSASESDDFYYTSVTGATTGDYLVVSSTSSEISVLGGVTFDTVATTPEPSTFALMLGGLAALILVATTRRGQA
jgi:hypothetical protein